MLIDKPNKWIINAKKLHNSKVQVQEYYYIIQYRV